MTATIDPEPLHATARWTAAVRAGERARPDRLVDDPWAELLAGPEGMAWLAGRSPASVLPIVIRTRYFDDWLRRVVIGGPVRQVVLLAAGLDTRAFRMPWPAGTTVFEIDRADVLDAKAIALDAAWTAPAAERRMVPADLGGPFADDLAECGFEPSEPAAFLAEGVSFYLAIEAIRHCLGEVSRIAARGSQLGFDCVNAAVLTSPLTRAWIELQAAAGAPWVGALDDPAGTVAALGWTPTLVQPGEPGANHGRWTLPVPPADRPDLPHHWYLTATRP